ncbi:MAG: hypothetical protein Q7R39_10315, partial [Dehalococcoidia bacterium]|nr:hypothetical protein [Dehalococcoidia bacterium]
QYEEPIDAAMAAGLGGIPAEVLAASMVLGPGEVRADIPMEQTDPDFLNREQLEEFFAKMKSARLDSLLKTLDKVSDAITIVARAEDLSTLATSPGEYERRPENATVKQLKHVARSCLNEIHKISANTRTEVSNVGDTPITAVSVSNPDALRKETNPLAGIVEDAAKSFS